MQHKMILTQGGWCISIALAQVPLGTIIAPGGSGKK